MLRIETSSLFHEILMDLHPFPSKFELMQQK